MGVDLKVYYRPWKADRQVPPEEALILVIDRIVADGYPVYRSGAGGLSETEPVLDLRPFTLLSVQNLSEAAWRKIPRDVLTPDSSRENAQLVVSKIEFILEEA